MKGINRNLLLIAIFMITVLGLFINKLTTPRTLSDDELLVSNSDCREIQCAQRCHEQEHGHWLGSWEQGVSTSTTIEERA